MCGFSGYINSKEKDSKIIKKMSEKIIHRGPDDEGIYEDNFLHIAFRRLSIIDLNNGHQPIYNEDNSLLIMFNGEIYNYKELKTDLIEKGHTFKTNTDTEVILHGYEEYKEEILNKLRGMFAFVIYNVNTQELFIGRDIFGIKPLYYTLMNDTFMFSSEIKSFLPNPNFKKELNEKALKTYLTFQYNPLKETFFKNVYKLEPSHYLIYKDGEITIKKYFTFDFCNQEGIKHKEKINECVSSSIDYHKISDVKTGAFLSSGMDSSYIVGVLKPDETFTVGFESIGFNETNEAKELCEILNIENTSKIISPDEFFEIIPKVQYHSDEPHANLSNIPLYYLSELASKHVKVVLSGEGADELFGGYETYKESKLLKFYRILPKFIRKFIKKLALKLPEMKGKHFLIRGGEEVEDYYIGQAFIFDNEEASNILTEKYKTETTYQDITAPYFKEVKNLDDVTKKQYLDMFLWLPNDILLKADKITMANSIELRVPYLDKEVFALASKLKPKEKIKGNISKYLLRESASLKIPEKWYDMPKKGFPVPFKEYIKNEKYYNIIKEEFSQSYVKEFFNVDELMRLLDLHYKGTKETHRKIYTIYCFLLWYKEYFLNN